MTHKIPPKVEPMVEEPPFPLLKHFVPLAERMEEIPPKHRVRALATMAILFGVNKELGAVLTNQVRYEDE